MGKPYDSACKKAVYLYPQEFTTWLMRGAIFIGTLPYELQQETLEVDGLLIVELDGQRIGLHIEFQTHFDEVIAARMLRYNVLARWAHGIPIISFLIQLLDEGEIPSSPFRWTLPNGKEIIDFHFEAIVVGKLSQEEILQSGLVALQPFLPLAKGGANRSVVAQMSKLLQEQKNTDLEVIGFTFASLAFRRNRGDQEWLVKRFQHMHDILRDTPIMQEILRMGREEGKQEGRQEALHKVLLMLLVQRFPTVKKQAKKLIARIEDITLLENLIIKVGLNSTTLEEIQHDLQAAQPPLAAKTSKRRTTRGKRAAQ